MQNPLVSIIVPIYKVEPYLRRCLDSIVNQTYTNLEIILVDDGSPDGCPQICDEYAAKDKRIVVIHKENGGLSDARNAGLDICKGEYISFVDSDDWVANVYIEILSKSITESKADIAICNFIKTSQNYDLNIFNYQESQATILQPNQAIAKLWQSGEDAIFVTAWGKLFKTELYKAIRFPKGKIHEDEYTSYKVLHAAKTISFIDIPLYNYFQRQDSIMGKAHPNSIKLLRSQVEKYIFFKKKKEFDILNLLLGNLCWNLLYALYQLKSGNRIPDYHIQKTKELLFIYKKAVTDYCKCDVPKAYKIILSFFRLFPNLYILYQRFSPLKIRTN